MGPFFISLEGQTERGRQSERERERERERPRRSHFSSRCLRRLLHRPRPRSLKRGRGAPVPCAPLRRKSRIAVGTWNRRQLRKQHLQPHDGQGRSGPWLRLGCEVVRLGNGQALLGFAKLRPCCGADLLVAAVACYAWRAHGHDHFWWLA